MGAKIIRLTNVNGYYFAETLGPDRQRVIDCMGTANLQTAYMLPMTMDEAARRIQALNPDSRVEFNGRSI